MLIAPITSVSAQMLFGIGKPLSGVENSAHGAVVFGGSPGGIYLGFGAQSYPVETGIRTSAEDARNNWGDAEGETITVYDYFHVGLSKQVAPVLYLYAALGMSTVSERTEFDDQT